LKNRSFELTVSAWLLVGHAAFSAACSGTSVDGAGRPSAPGGGGDAGAGGGSTEPHASVIAFLPGNTIPLDPKESRELTVRTDPAGQFPIRFSLISGDVMADTVLDAVLDATDVQTDAEGIAHVTLIAPSKPTSFNVRASSPSAQSAFQAVVVKATDKTDLRVRPSYNGHRPIAKWTATAHTGMSCSQLTGNPPLDGSPLVSKKPNEDLVLRVPVNVDLAITVRAGHYIGGCVNQSALSEGEDNQVLVYASDRPLNLSATNLTLSLGASEAHPAFDKLLQQSATEAEAALLGSAKNDVLALLEGMRNATAPVDLEAFDATRTESDWDSVLESAFGKSGARRMRDPALRWLTAGLAALNAPNALVGKLSPLGSAATFTPSSIGGAAAEDAGFPGFFPAKWSADSNDTVLLGMELNWEVARLVTALALGPARLEFPQATSVEQALALSVGCTQVGQVLLASRPTPGLTAFADCDESCLVHACESAVAAAWTRAKVGPDATIARLAVTATAAAQVGDDARATGLSGTWLGELQTDTGTAPVSGALSAE